jgi:peptidoglycan/LPS O-acetylase OafA/YrhL
VTAQVFKRVPRLEAKEIRRVKDPQRLQTEPPYAVADSGLGKQLRARVWRQRHSKVGNLHQLGNLSAAQERHHQYMGRPTAQAAGTKLVFIEGMRGLAALYVVLGHICSIAYPGVFLGAHADAPEWLRLVMQPFGFGHLAVAAFIVISGFCLQTSLFSKGDGTLQDAKTFFKRRALRILPPYYACLAISLFVVYKITPLGGPGLPFNLYTPVNPQVIAAHIFMVHNLSPEWMYKINGVLWSIAIESQLYILFPVLVFLINKAYRLPTLLLSMSISASVLILWPKAEKFYPWYFALFVLGMTASHLAYNPPKWRGPNALASMLFGGACLVGAIYSAARGFPMPVMDAWMGACVVSVIYACTVSKKFTVGKLLSLKPLAWLGTISYSLYLMHHPILQPLYIFRPEWAHAPAMATVYLLAVGLPVILLGVVAFWFIFERPFCGRKKGSGKPGSRPLSASKKAVVNAPDQPQKVAVGSRR